MERIADVPGAERYAFWARDDDGNTIGCAERGDGSSNWVMAGRLPNGKEFSVQADTAWLLRKRFIYMMRV